jgi:membrane-associated protein
MDLIHQFVDFFLHLDKHLGDIIQNYGTLTYGILFAIVFCETGLVVTPFLPGDSLLFAVGALSHAENAVLNPFYCYILLTAAALLGDNSNYWIGRFFGPKVFGRFVKKKYMDQTHDFYEKHGILTLIIAQFAPIIRTFAPFVAGVGRMTYSKFVILNLIGVLSWTTIFVWAGYFFGGMPMIQQNFHYVILAIIVISLTPIALEVVKAWNSGKKRR